MVEKVITNLDSSKATGLDCIPVVVLKNCEPELLYIQAEIFSICLKESCIPDCWKVSSVVPVCKNVTERSTAKNYHLVSLLSVVSKVFEKLVNNRIVDYLKKCGLSAFQYGFRSFRSTADLLTVLSDRIAGAFSRSGATRAVALDISKAHLAPPPYSRGRSTPYSDSLHDFSVTITRCYKDLYVSSFFPRTGILCLYNAFL